MNVQGVIPILNISNLQESFAWFAKLGWTKRWDFGEPPDFGAVGNGTCEIFLCEDCQGCRAGHGGTGTWLGWFVSTPAEVDAAYALAQQKGVTVAQPPWNTPWNMRELHVRHPDGHIFRIGAGLNDEAECETELRNAGPPLLIERVEVSIRLERRLAALLRDLAEHKRMSVDSCLEETLLHTFEQVGGGVASPHTKKTLDHIKDLKKKHDIDYDVHASYRFVER